MKLRVFDILLLIVILVGGVYVWKSGQERSRLTARYARLAGITGDLKITDPTKLHFQALETDDPMHFAWRMYFPPSYKQVLHSPSTGGTSWSSGASEFIGRVRFRLNEQGYLDVYTHFAGGSSRTSNVNGALAKLFSDHWDKIKVEQLGAHGLTVLDPDKTVPLLQLKLTDEFQAEAKKSLSTPIPSQFVPVFYELKLGPDASKP